VPAHGAATEEDPHKATNAAQAQHDVLCIFLLPASAVARPRARSLAKLRA